METILKLAVDGTWKVVESTLDPKIAVPSSDQQGNNNYSEHLHSVCFDRKSCVKIVFHVGDFFLKKSHLRLLLNIEK